MCVLVPSTQSGPEYTINLKWRHCNEVGTFGPYNYRGLFLGWGENWVEVRVRHLGFRIGPGDIIMLVNVLTKRVRVVCGCAHVRCWPLHSQNISPFMAFSFSFETEVTGQGNHASCLPVVAKTRLKGWRITERLSVIIPDARCLCCLLIIASVFTRCQSENRVPFPMQMEISCPLMLTW